MEYGEGVLRDKIDMKGDNDRDRSKGRQKKPRQTDKMTEKNGGIWRPH